MIIVKKIRTSAQVTYLDEEEMLKMLKVLVLMMYKTTEKMHMVTHTSGYILSALTGRCRSQVGHSHQITAQMVEVVVTVTKLSHRSGQPKQTAATLQLTLSLARSECFWTTLEKPEALESAMLCTITRR